MRLARSALFAIILVAGFFYFTTHHSDAFHSAGWPSRPQHVEITEAASNESFDAEEQNNISVYRKNIGSVVNITSRIRSFDFFYGQYEQEGQGSGFIIDKEGRVLTNYHVIENASKVYVTLHGHEKQIPASIVGTDKAHDLAVIQIKIPDPRPMTLGDSSNLQVGQKVYAIGNPFGLGGTLTRGIVSSIRGVREPDGIQIEDAIQTDAAINPGNSGGPLLNLHGEVIGINTVIASNGAAQSAGIGFAIPINTAKAVLNDLVTLGRVRRPALAVRTLPIDSELASELGLAADYGLLIVEALPGGAADRAGLRGGTDRAYLGNMQIFIGGDLIVAIDGKEIGNQQDLAQVMNDHRAGDTVKVTIFRGKKKMEVNVELGESREQV
jgi:S1-C subfamily serine protease